MREQRSRHSDICGGVAILVLLSSLACGRSEQPAAPPPAASNAPRTRTDATSATFFGVSVPDPYRWLEDGSAPEVTAWIDAQNKHTDAVMNAFTEGPEIAKRVETLATTSPERSAPQIAGGTLFYLRETPPQPQPVLVAEKWPNGEARVLVDLNASGGSVSIAAYWPSPKGRYLAYGTAEGGSELTTIHFVETASGKTLPDTLPYAGGGTTPQALAWAADERGVTYARFPTPDAGQPVKQFGAALYRHRLGAPATDDGPVFGADYSPIAEYRLVSSDDGRLTTALANKGDGGFADVVFASASGWRQVIADTAGVIEATYDGDRLLVVA